MPMREGCAERSGRGSAVTARGCGAAFCYRWNTVLAARAAIWMELRAFWNYPSLPRGMGRGEGWFAFSPQLKKKEKKKKKKRWIFRGISSRWVISTLLAFCFVVLF